VSTNSPDRAADLALRLAAADDVGLDDIIDDALRQLAADVSADRAYVTMVLPNGKFRNSHEYSAPGVMPQQPAIQNMSLSDFPYSSSMARDGRIVSVDTPESWPDEAAAERASFGAFGVRAVLEVPIISDGEHIGAVGFNHLSDHTWDQEVVDRLALFGRAIGVVLRRRTVGERVERARIAAEQANRVKDDLISRASHELRTPLHAVLGFAELLELDGVHHPALQQIRANGQLLLTMIDDLLELAQFASQAEHDSDVPIADLFDRLVSGLRAVANERGVELITDAGHPFATNSAAAARLHQGLHCVAATAITMAGRNGSVRITSIPGSYPCIEFVVRGTQGRNASGLGLALARSFLEEVSAAVSVIETETSTAMTVRLS
jgi:signal transduction histidine kinase